MVVILAAMARATPTAPPELRDAAAEANRVIEACQAAMRAGTPCTDRSTLAEAAVVRALASLVDDGVLATQSSIDAWALDPNVAEGWTDLIGQPAGPPSPWVEHAMAPRTREANAPAAAPRPKKPMIPTPTGPNGWWSAAIAGDVALFDGQEGVRGSQGVSLQAMGGAGHLAVGARTEVGRTGLDLSDMYQPVNPEDQLKTRFSTVDARTFIGAGYHGGLAQTFQFLVGPVLGLSGFPHSTREQLIQRGLRPNGASLEAGVGVQARARLVVDRIAGVFDMRTALTHVAPARTSGIWSGTQTGIDLNAGPQQQVFTSMTAELQAKLTQHLWWTLAVRLDETTKIGAQPLELIDTVSIESGARWR